MTKCGRYGKNTFDYSPATIRESVKNSLRRLQTDYLDTVYLHDVEFVCTQEFPKASGNHITALTTDAMLYEGDQKILDAISELRKLQDEGLVKNIGISGMAI